MENKELITKAVRYIMDNPRENLNLQAIADNAGFSLAYFDTLFLKHTGYSAVEYSRVYKLTRSAYELRFDPKKTVLDIALDYGYASPEVFSRAFRSFYGLSPTEYRDKHAEEPTGWKDLSSKIAISRFEKAFPELKPVSEDTVLDFAFTHNPMLWFEDVIEFEITEVKAFTLEDQDNPNSFVLVSDYDEPEPFINLVCSKEEDAVRYLNLLRRLGNFKFTLHKEPGILWEDFDHAAAIAGFTCLREYDMICTTPAHNVPIVQGFAARELSKDDIPFVSDFQRRGGCGISHLRSLEMTFEGKGNLGQRGFGLFDGKQLVGLVICVPDAVRNLRKYDFGAVFGLGKGEQEEAKMFLCRTALNACLENGFICGSAGTKDDDLAFFSKLGMETTAECCHYAILRP